jgi:hypothetical protein
LLWSSKNLGLFTVDALAFLSFAFCSIIFFQLS